MKAAVIDSLERGPRFADFADPEVGTTAPLSQKAATAVINLVLGTAIGSLINGTAARVIRRRAITGGYQPSYPSSAPGN